MSLRSLIARVNDDVLREIFFWTVIALDRPWPDVTPFPALEISVKERARAIVRLTRVCNRFREVIRSHAVIWALVAGVPSTDKGFKPPWFLLTMRQLWSAFPLLEEPIFGTEEGMFSRHYVQVYFHMMCFTVTLITCFVLRR